MVDTSADIPPSGDELVAEKGDGVDGEAPRTWSLSGEGDIIDCPGRLHDPVSLCGLIDHLGIFYLGFCHYVKENMHQKHQQIIGFLKKDWTYCQEIVSASTLPR
jgi:hypothetical protein